MLNTLKPNRDYVFKSEAGETTWIPVKDVSVYLCHGEDGVRVELYPYGEEDGECSSHCSLEFSGGVNATKIIVLGPTMQPQASYGHPTPINEYKVFRADETGRRAKRTSIATLPWKQAMSFAEELSAEYGLPIEMDVTTKQPRPWETTQIAKSVGNENL